MGIIILIGEMGWFSDYNRYYIDDADWNYDDYIDFENVEVKDHKNEN